MGIEVEKKYRVTVDELARLRGRLHEINAESRGEEFEENTLYGGGNLDPQTRVLRLRRTEGKATLTYKERSRSQSAIKRQREDETRVENPDALHQILEALGFAPALVYEKRRETWRVANEVAAVEVVLDELPFGSFVEIEGEERAIIEAERMLNLTHAEAEHATYPELAARHGTRRGGRTIEARFTPEANP